MIVVGIDPGLTGAVAYFVDGELMGLFDMPNYDGRVDARELFLRLREWGRPYMVVIEDVHSMPGQGVASSFKFGRSVGAIEAVVGALSYPHTRLTPQKWKQKMGLIGKDKDASRGMARELWPLYADKFARKKDDGRAEAALIAEAWRRTNANGN